MTNELLIEALNRGIKILKIDDNQSCLSCYGLISCDECKFYTIKSARCKLIENGNYITKENFKFLEENYPEYLLKV